MRFRLELFESIKAQGSGTMRLPETQVAHGVPGAIHSLPGVSAPNCLRHDSCDSSRQRRKAHSPQFPWQRRRGVWEATEVLRAQPTVPGTAPQASDRSWRDPAGAIGCGQVAVPLDHVRATLSHVRATKLVHTQDRIWCPLQVRKLRQHHRLLSQW